MYQTIIADHTELFEEAIAHFSEEMAKLRTGRATPALVDHILVDYYNTRSPLKQIASVSAPEAKLIVISPWDKGTLVMIEAAIREANLGLNPANDGQVIRLSLPPLTEERRKDLVKALNRLAEEARIAVRTIREDAWKEIQAREKEGGMSEDDKFQGKDALQDVVETYNARIEELRKKKEGEIMTV
jgi:ribosome recycling factor